MGVKIAAYFLFYGLLVAVLAGFASASCGDGRCENVATTEICESENCPVSESYETCPQDCPAPASVACSNGLQDSGEKGVDCGGPCELAGVVDGCDEIDNDRDCVVDEGTGSFRCAVKQKAPPCYNGVRDGNETGIDCGGRCASPSMIEFCDGKDNDMDCTVDEACKSWPSGSGGSSGGLSDSGREGSGGGNSQGPPDGYRPFKVPQPHAEGSADADSASLPYPAEVQPSQKAPDIATTASIPQDVVSSQPEAVPAEQAPAVSSVQIVSGASEAITASSSQPKTESQPAAKENPNALVRIARFFRKLFG